MAQKPEILPYGRQHIDDDDIEAVVSALKSDFLTTGPRVESFETALAEKTGAKHAIAVANGTVALYLAYRAVGLGPGNKIVVPAITFLATASAAELAGAEVVLCDVDADSGLMSPKTLHEAFSRHPDAKAVAPVHLNGQCCDMGGLADVAAQHNAVLIEDACHAIGGDEWNSHTQEAMPVGSCGASVAACFSFHPVKTITMGEGGAVTCNDDTLADQIRLLRSHGMRREPRTGEDWPRDCEGQVLPWFYRMDEPSFNFRVTDIQCALGESQLKKLDRFVAAREQLANRYNEAFAELSNKARPVARMSLSRTAWHLYPMLCLGGPTERGELFNFLASRGIRPQVHYVPLFAHDHYRRTNDPENFPGANNYYDRVLSLPLFYGLSQQEQDHVITAVRDFYSD